MTVVSFFDSGQNNFYGDHIIWDRRWNFEWLDSFVVAKVTSSFMNEKQIGTPAGLKKSRPVKRYQADDTGRGGHLFPHFQPSPSDFELPLDLPTARVQDGMFNAAGHGFM